MNKNLILGAVICLILVAGGAYIVSSSSDDPATSSNASISNQLPSLGEPTTNQMQSVDMSPIAEDLAAQVRSAISRQSMSNVVVLDVRTDEEWNESHATDALHWGLAEHIDKGELPPLGKNMEIYVYCRSGNRAAQAIKVLQEAGYTDLTNIRGLEDWVTAGGATVSGVDGSIQ